MSEQTDVIVVGGGVIGLACANALLDAGRSVRVVERETVGSGASHGNCGLITPSHALPLNRPGMVRKALRWMWRADSPILVRPRLDWEFLAWGLRFARNCRPEAMHATMRGRAQLLESSRELFVELIEKDGLACEWETAEEDVDVVGLSILSGAFLPLCRKVKEELAARKIQDALLIVGGNIPARNHAGWTGSSRRERPSRRSWSSSARARSPVEDGLGAHFPQVAE